MSSQRYIIRPDETQSGSYCVFDLNRKIFLNCGLTLQEADEARKNLESEFKHESNVRNYSTCI